LYQVLQEAGKANSRSKPMLALRALF